MYLHFVLPGEIKDKTVIVAPLDWGMGHVTRCIPVIRQLLAGNCKVIFAGNDVQIALIQKDFNQVICEKIPGYEVTLNSRASTYRQILLQYRKMKKMARNEHALANVLVAKHGADLVISDNRFGFFADDTYNIFITHQLKPQIPIFRKKVQKLIAGFISRFSCCWIPDNEYNPICGELVNAQVNVPVYFIGLLSRFEKVDLKKNLDILVIVSGPEPERSRFQNLVYQCLNDRKVSFKIVTPNAAENDSFITNPSTSELEHLINGSALVVSRAGYTTIMELIHLEKDAILIPTKGQFEQEYLAGNICNPNLKFMSEQQLFGFLKHLASTK